MKNMFQQINQLDRQIGGIYHEAALKMGFSDSELWILYALSVSAAGCRQTELCQSTGMTKTTVNSALKKMEEAGVLYRAPGSGRNTLVFLTEQGAALAERTVNFVASDIAYASSKPKTRFMRAGRRRNSPYFCG